MRKSLRSLAFAVPVVAIALAFFGGSALGSVIGHTHNGAVPAPALQPGHKAPTYQKNARGLTMGKGVQAATPAEMPDLIEARTLDGKDGYVKKTDLDTEPTFTTPAQAASHSAADQHRQHTINVYLADGTTVIGQLIIGG